MKPGRVSETVYKRSILQCMDYKTQKVCQGLEVGMDASVYQPLGGICPVTSAATVMMRKKQIGIFALYRAVNRLAAFGALGKGAWVNFVFPDWFMESDLKEVMTELNREAKRIGIEITGVYAEAAKGMECPIITISAYGEVSQADWITPKQIEAGMDILMTKYAGTEGALMVAFEQEKELFKRFTPSFVDQIYGFLDQISGIREAQAAVKHGVKAMHMIGEGGVFGALWEMAEAADLGVEVNIRQIPILQETIEVCELFHMNPYQISSTGSMLMAAKDGHRLAEKLRQMDISVKVIGHMTQGKERVLLHEEEKRFLEPPKMDELLKGLKENQSGG